MESSETLAYVASQAQFAHDIREEWIKVEQINGATVNVPIQIDVTKYRRLNIY